MTSDLLHARPGIPAPGTLAPRPGTPPYVRRVIEEAARDPIVAVAAASQGFDPASPVLISVVRNERAVLGEFLAHYRRLGIERFAMIDNGSNDGSAEILAGERDVDLYATARAFRHKQGWISAVIARYGHDRWYLHADADEHIVFDGAGGRSFTGLAAFAAARGLRRVRGMLVDLYAPGPLIANAAGGRLAERFALFDATGYEETLCLERISRKGGPRRRKFSVPGDRFDPELTKYPLFHIRAGEVFASPHNIYPYHENYRSDCLLGVLHYKFTEGLLDKARRASAEENYWDRSLEYKRYLDVLTRTPDLALTYPGSRAYRRPADLVDAGLIAPIAWAGRRGFLQSVAHWHRRRRAQATGLP